MMTEIILGFNLFFYCLSFSKVNNAVDINNALQFYMINDKL